MAYTFRDLQERLKELNKREQERGSKSDYTIFSIIFEERYSIERSSLEAIAQEMAAVILDVMDGTTEPENAERAFIDNMKEYHEELL